jgi:predicted nucleic acid-binding protein
MRLEDALAKVTRIFLDTAPVVYFVEENPDFLPVVIRVFERIERGDCLGIVSPVTLAECLVMPFRNQLVELQEQFVELMIATDGIEAVGLSIKDGILAGELRAKYNLQLPDALQMATAISENCDAFLTNDLNLRRVKELRVLALTELEV